MAPATAMTPRKLGRTNLMVAPICFGTSALGDMPMTYGYSVDEARAYETVRAIFDGPAPFLDVCARHDVHVAVAAPGDAGRSG